MKNDLEPDNDEIAYLEDISGYEQNLPYCIQLKELSKLGAFYCICYDFVQNKYLHVSDSVYHVLGYNPYKSINESSGLIAESIHHVDFLNTQKAIYNHIKKYVEELSATQISKHIFRYYLWVQNKNKQYLKLHVNMRFFKKKNTERLEKMVALCYKVFEGEPKESIQTLQVFKISNSFEKKVYEKDFIVEYENGLLTKKETQVWLMLKENMSGRKIAEELGLSIHTVNTHRKNIYKKLRTNVS